MDLSDLSIFSGALSRIEVWLTVVILCIIIIFIYVGITDVSKYDQDCKIDMSLYEKLRPTISDVNAVALFDFILDDGLLHIDDVEYLHNHAEIPVKEIVKTIVCETNI